MVINSIAKNTTENTANNTFMLFKQRKIFTVVSFASGFSVVVEEDFGFCAFYCGVCYFGTPPVSSLRAKICTNTLF